MGFLFRQFSKRINTAFLHQLNFYYCCMKQRIYLDTSIIGGAFDEEFEKITNQLFEMALQKKITLVISDVTEKELANAPLEVISFFAALNNADIEFVFNNEECINLANLYIKEGVVGQTSFDDCQHIAIATVHKVDVLASWNFKHIVNIIRIRGYNSVNLKLGYQVLEIRPPNQIIDYEN